MLENLKAGDAYMATILPDTTIGNQQAIEAAYIAGLMDGEGTFCISKDETKKTVRYTPRISMGITNQAIATKFRVFLEKNGIAFYASKRIYKEPFLPVYSFEVRRFLHVLVFIDKVLPYLVGKKQQAELLKRFALSRLDSDGNVTYRRNSRNSEGYPSWVPDIWLECRILNGKGRPKGTSGATKTEQLRSLNDCTSTCEIIYGLTNDTVSPAIESCS